MSNIHKIAQSGFGTGTNELYDRVRPSYQPFALNFVRGAIRGSPPFNIVEIGAGTGIFTRAILAHSDLNSVIGEIRSIEPSEGMRNVFSQTVKDERVSINNGTFDDTGVPNEWADMVVIAQAFHWCPDYDKASAEFARILKPNGIVALVWNLEDRDGARWAAQLRDRIERHEAGSPQFRRNLWRQTFSTQSYQKFFEAPKEEVWTYDLEATSDIVVDRASSKSYIAVLPNDEKEGVRRDIRNILEKGDDKVWIDENAGVFKYPYKAYVVIAEKKQLRGVM